MFELSKTGKSWEEWEVYFKGNKFILGSGTAVPVDDELYDFPCDSNCKISIAEIEQLSFIDIPKELYLRIESLNNSFGQNVQRIYLDCRFGKAKIEYAWSINLAEWSEHINPVFVRNETYNALLNSSHNTEGLFLQEIEDHDAGFIDLYFEYTTDLNDNIGETLNSLKLTIDEAYEIAKNKVSSNGFAEDFIARFAFDPAVQDSCVRYLHFFIEFLKDMGISADSSISRKGPNVLFSIHPTDKDTSLTKIKEALALYLNLPEFNLGILNTSQMDPIIELKIEKITAEISRLKTDIKLNQAILNYENKTSLSTSETNSKLKEADKYSLGVTPIEGFQSITIDNKVEKKEEFLGGFIKLGTFKKAGIEFDWSTLFRRLRK